MAENAINAQFDPDRQYQSSDWYSWQASSCSALLAALITRRSAALAHTWYYLAGLAVPAGCQFWLPSCVREVRYIPIFYVFSIGWYI